MLTHCCQDIVHIQVEGKTAKNLQVRKASARLFQTFVERRSRYQLKYLLVLLNKNDRHPDVEHAHGDAGAHGAGSDHGSRAQGQRLHRPGVQPGTQFPLQAQDEADTFWEVESNKTRNPSGTVVHGIWASLGFSNEQQKQTTRMYTQMQCVITLCTIMKKQDL